MSKLRPVDGSVARGVRQAARRRAPREDGRRTRAAIIAATLRVLRDHGIGALTHRAVAQEAGVSLALTTYHFASKENLIAEALAVAAEETIDHLRATAAPPDGAPPARASVADTLSDMTMARLGDERLAVFAVVELSLAAARRPSLHPTTAEWNRAYHGIVADLLAHAGIAAPEQAARLVVATLEGLVFLQLTESDPAFEHTVLRPSLRALIDALPSAAAPRT